MTRMDEGPRAWQVNEGNYEGGSAVTEMFPNIWPVQTNDHAVFNSTGLFIIRSGYLAPVEDEPARLFHIHQRRRKIPQIVAWIVI